jgi:hypothetical protein
VFDRPVAQITIKGLTRLFNCGDRRPSPTPTPTPRGPNVPG